MEWASNIDAKKPLYKTQYDRPHDDDGDIGEYEEENTSNHKIFRPKIIQKLPKSQVYNSLTKKGLVLGIKSIIVRVIVGGHF